MRLLSINIGKKQTLQNKDRLEITGIHKTPAQTPMKLTELGIAEDFIGSPKHHGGADQAVYVYGEADYQWWERELGRGLTPGIFGENLTISQLESAMVSAGDFFHIGDVLLQATTPRIPCGTFASHMKDPQWVKKFRQAERPGFYCRVMRVGVIQAGDAVSFEKFSGETISILQLYRDYYEKNRSREILRRHLNAPLSARWRKKMQDELNLLSV
jgi:MOSC domain-containing protein YiiM